MELICECFIFSDWNCQLQCWEWKTMKLICLSKKKRPQNSSFFVHICGNGPIVYEIFFEFHRRKVSRVFLMFSFRRYQYVKITEKFLRNMLALRYFRLQICYSDASTHVLWKCLFPFIMNSKESELFKNFMKKILN